MAARTYMVVDARRDHSFRVPRPVIVGRGVAGVDVHQAQLRVDRRHRPDAASRPQAVAPGRPRHVVALVARPLRNGVEDPADLRGPGVGGDDRPARTDDALRDRVGTEVARPERLAARRVEGKGGAGRVAEIQDAVDYHRRHLRDDVVPFHLDRPGQLEPPGVRRVDLVDRGVAAAVQIEVVRRPVKSLAAGRFLCQDRNRQGGREGRGDGNDGVGCGASQGWHRFLSQRLPVTKGCRPARGSLSAPRQAPNVPTVARAVNRPNG